jgi:hypothetical protein
MLNYCFYTLILAPACPSLSLLVAPAVLIKAICMPTNGRAAAFLIN